MCVYVCVCVCVCVCARACLCVCVHARVCAVCDDDGSGEMDLGEFLDMLRKAGQVGLLPAVTATPNLPVTAVTSGLIHP